MAMGTSPLLNETGLEGEAGGTMLGRLASRRQWRESRCGQLDVAVDEAMEVVKATLRCEPRLDKTPGAVLSASPPPPQWGAGCASVSDCAGPLLAGLAGQRRSPLPHREESSCLPVWFSAA